MPNIHREGLIIATHPMFYDALSGSFSPNSNTHTTHGLGRLAYVAFNEGEYILGPQITTPRGRMYPFGFGFEPRWAPGAVATALGEVNRAQTFSLEALHLGEMGEPDNKLMVFSSVEGDFPDIVHGVQVVTDEARFYPLGTSSAELPDQLAEAQMAIAGAAKTFFDSIKTA